MALAPHITFSQNAPHFPFPQRTPLSPKEKYKENAYFRSKPETK